LDTQSNNASSSTTVLTVDGNPDDADYGDFTVLYNGQTLSESFIDSGSNGYYFNDSSIPACPSPNEDFYCPSSTTTYSASVESFGSSASTTFSFIVANADAQPSADTAYPGLAGTTTLANNFDLGLPFYFGRRVVTAIQGYSTSSGTGPYVAY
jgi:hypothetical protein